MAKLHPPPLSLRHPHPNCPALALNYKFRSGAQVGSKILEVSIQNNFPGSVTRLFVPHEHFRGLGGTFSHTSNRPQTRGGIGAQVDGERGRKKQKKHAPFVNCALELLERTIFATEGHTALPLGLTACLWGW